MPLSKVADKGIAFAFRHCSLINSASVLSYRIVTSCASLLVLISTNLIVFSPMKGSLHHTALGQDHIFMLG